MNGHDLFWPFANWRTSDRFPQRVTFKAGVAIEATPAVGTFEVPDATVSQGGQVTATPAVGNFALPAATVQAVVQVAATATVGNFAVPAATVAIGGVGVPATPAIGSFVVPVVTVEGGAEPVEEEEDKRRRRRRPTKRSRTSAVDLVMTVSMSRSSFWQRVIGNVTWLLEVATSRWWHARGAPNEAALSFTVSIGTVRTQSFVVSAAADIEVGMTVTSYNAMDVLRRDVNELMALGELEAEDALLLLSQSEAAGGSASMPLYVMKRSDANFGK